jgi:carbamoyl-phosphate synthase large subunit
LRLAAEIGYPLVVRPSYVLGGRAMEIVHEPRDLERYMREAVKVSNDSPVLLDRFLNDACEVDVDALSDGEEVIIGGVMEHIEQAGVHSGDSACSLPPYSLSKEMQDELRRQTKLMAKGLNVCGLMNVQFAIQNDVVYVLEVNPRASRTVPSSPRPPACRWPRSPHAAWPASLASQGVTQEVIPPYFSVKEAVFPFIKFPGVDTILGPEMKSTGEVMGVGTHFSPKPSSRARWRPASLAESRARSSSASRIRTSPRRSRSPRDLHAAGFTLLATRGTAAR